MSGELAQKQSIARRVERAFRNIGASVQLACRVVTTKFDGCIDLVVSFRDQRITCEIEVSNACIRLDIAKARAVHAAMLLVVVPDEELAKTIRTMLAGVQFHAQSPLLRMDCLAVNAFLRQLRNEHFLLSALNVGAASTHQTGSASATLLPEIASQKGKSHANPLAQHYRGHSRHSHPDWAGELLAADHGSADQRQEHFSRPHDRGQDDGADHDRPHRGGFGGHRPDSHKPGKVNAEKEETPDKPNH